MEKPQIGHTTVRTPRRAASASPSERAYLVVFVGETTAIIDLPAEGDLVLGRGDDAQVRLEDRGISRQHARIVVSKRGVRLHDLGSQNGTWVNDVRVEGDIDLASEDVIAVGGVTLVLHAPKRRVIAAPSLGADALRARAHEEVERALRYTRPLSVLAIAFGPAARDAIIVTDAFDRSVRTTDLLGWASPDLAVVLMPETDAHLAIPIAERLVALLLPGAAGVRAAVASCPAHGSDADALLGVARDAAAAASAGKVVPGTSAFRTLELGDRVAVVADPAMARVYALLERIAPSDLPALICGETGTGKELAAAAVHHGSKRKSGPFLPVNCAALHEALLESALFGYERGAFTGASAAKAGVFEAASGGTVFLDEVGELSLQAQAKLLRVLESKRVVRLGDVRERDVDVRIVAATNKNLKEEVEAGAFRKDLYYRLCGATVWLPPLRDRPRELPGLVHRFVSEACARGGRPPLAVSAAAMQALAAYPWPGNVRELRNAVEYACVTADEAVLEPWHFDALGPPAGERGSVTGNCAAFRPLEEEVQELEESRMRAALGATDGNQTKAATLISMPLRTFTAKMKQYRISARR